MRKLASYFSGPSQIWQIQKLASYFSRPPPNPFATKCQAQNWKCHNAGFPFWIPFGVSSWDSGERKRDISQEPRGIPVHIQGSVCRKNVVLAQKVGGAVPWGGGQVADEVGGGGVEKLAISQQPAGFLSTSKEVCVGRSTGSWPDQKERGERVR